MPSEKTHCVYYIIAEKYIEPGVEPRVSRLKYERVNPPYTNLKLIRETSVIDLNRTINSSVFQFAAYFKGT